MEKLRDELAIQNLKAWKQVIPFGDSNKDIKLSSDEIFGESFDDLTTYEIKQQGYDNSLKRNSAFIKKMKIPITKTNVESILKDISELSLEKYMSEIITNYLETLQNLKSAKDIIPNVRAISALHQRFTIKFTHHIHYFLLNQIDKIQLENNLHGSVKKSVGLTFDYSQLDSSENMLRSAKLKIFLKLFIECYLVKLFDVIDLDSPNEYPNFITYVDFSSDKYKSLIEADLITVEVIKLLFHPGDSIMLNSLVIIDFLNEYGEIFCNKNLVSENMAITFKTIMNKLNNTVLNLLKISTKNLKKIRLQILKFNINRGVSNEENEKNEKACIRLFENSLAIHDFLCELFHFESITLTEEAEDDKIVYTKDGKTEKLLIDGVAIWENIDEYKFYTNVEDITDYVLDTSQETSEDIQNDVSDLSASKADQMSKFIDSLLECETKESLLQLSVKFWNWKLMNKASYNRLLVLFTSTKNSNKFKFFGRFLALNKNLLGDFLEELLTKLKNSISFMVLENSSADRKILNTNMKSYYFFLELIKFNLIPTHHIFFILRNLILTIKPRKLNVELINIFFEKVGRFLYYCCGSESKSLMNDMMKLLEDKAADKKMSTDERLIIKYFNDIIHAPAKAFYAYTFINEDDSIISLLSPQQLFIKKLITEDLAPDNWHHVIFCILQLDFTHTENFFFLASIFTKPEMLKFENIEILAKMLVVLRKVTSKSLFVYVVDFLLEYLESTIESTDLLHNRKRVTRTRYLAEIICLITNDPVANEINNEKKHEKFKKRLNFTCEAMTFMSKSLIELRIKLSNLPVDYVEFDVDMYNEELRFFLRALILQLEEGNISNSANYIEQNLKEEDKLNVYKVLKQKIMISKNNIQPDIFDAKIKKMNDLESFDTSYESHDDIKIMEDFLTDLIKLCDDLGIDSLILHMYRMDFKSLGLFLEENISEEKHNSPLAEVKKKNNANSKKLKKSKASRKNTSETIQFPNSSSNLLSIFFKMGFFLIGHGYPSVRFGLPSVPPPGFYNMLDPPNDFRRVDLLLILLETTISHGFFFQTFSIKSGSHKYDHIITNSEWKNYRKQYLLLIACLNYYIETKQRPFPSDITFKANNFFRMMEKCGFYHYSNDIQYILKTYFKHELKQPHDQQTQSDICQEMENQLEKDLQDELEKEFDDALQNIAQEENINNGNAADSANNMTSDSKINVLLDSKLSKESLNIDLGKVDFKLVSRNRDGDQLNITPISVSLDNDFFSDKVVELNKKLEEEDILRKKTIQSLLE